MEKLKQYLSSLPAHEKAAYAASCGTTLGYLRKAIYKKPHPVMDAALARLLDEHSGGFVSKAELRPDVWPELVKAA